MPTNLVITESAQHYLSELLEKQNKSNMGIRIFVERPGTPYAECCMAYCAEGEAAEDDCVLSLPVGLTAWIEKASLLYLEDAVVDYAKERMGGQLTFRAPKSKVPQLGEHASTEERVNHVLYSEINPSLASHGGMVSLVELVDEGTTAVLQFGGGCQGCAAVDLTLKQGVEKTLLEQVPEIKRVRDATDHSVKENAYY
ncbi:MAG: Fe-S biogenesis protein NfuA [Gammaproteobacteria bacterium]